MVKILVIDDDPDVADIVSIIFELRWPDAVVMPAGDGETGVEMAKAESPDIVILDLGLPGIDGFEVCRQIRRFSQVPVVILSVRDTPEAMALGKEVGANDYVTKPFNPNHLLERVQAVLQLQPG